MCPPAIKTFLTEPLLPAQEMPLNTSFTICVPTEQGLSLGPGQGGLLTQDGITRDKIF